MFSPFVTILSFHSKPRNVCSWCSVLT